MSVYSASIDREDDITRLRIYQSEWVIHPQPAVSTEIVNVAIDPHEIPSLQPYGFKAVGWTQYGDEHGIRHAITFCRKINE